MSLAVNLGGTFATTIMLNIFNNNLAKFGISFSASGSQSFEAIESLGREEQVFLREKARGAIVLAFFAITAFMWLGVLAVSALGNVDIAKQGKEGEHVVTRGSFLGSLVGRRRTGGK